MGINLGLPVIVGVQDFTKLTDGEIITVDPVRGLVYKGHACLLYTSGQNTTEAISYATCSTAATLGATAIISASKTGSTARMVAKYRPQAPIIATTPDEKVARRLLLVWGVYPLIVDESNNSDRLFAKSVDIAKENGYIKEGDLVVLTDCMDLKHISGTRYA